MHINYKYVLYKIETLIKDKSLVKVLDYGCGAGDVVKAGQFQGFNIYGVDSYISDRRDDVKKKGLYDTIIKEIKNDVIPFADDYFGLVVNNQVFEHVEDL